jgi:DNA-directed RNA polymerase beta subunit
MLPSARQGPLPRQSTLSSLHALVEPHIASFNGLLDGGLARCASALPAGHIRLASGSSAQFWLEDVAISRPTRLEAAVSDPRLLPAECRERGCTYGGELRATLVRRVNGGEPLRTTHRLGAVPIMLRSSRCHLEGLSPAALVAAREEAAEAGGYFIVNGIERIIRMLQIPKRNYPMAITRSSYARRGRLYTDKGVAIRCVRPGDQSSATLTLHYLSDGSVTARFTVRKQEFFVPVMVILKALTPTTDREVYEHVLAGEKGNTFLSDRLLALLRGAKETEWARALQTQAGAAAVLGARFRPLLPHVSPDATDAEAGAAVLAGYVLVHIAPECGADKFALLLMMLRKLYAFVGGAVGEDNADSLAHQEIMLGGTLLQTLLKEKLGEMLEAMELQASIEDRSATRAMQEAAAAAAKEVSDGEQGGGEEEEDGGGGGGAPAAPAAAAKRKRLPPPVDLNDSTWWRKLVERRGDIGRKVAYLLATGNLVSSTGLDMQQVSGYTVVADKLNFFRFTSHFRSVHRGQFFTTMKTTTVRKLLPESWGFLCPIHTPDGGPCGLLNHISAPASVAALPLSEAAYAARCAEAAAGAAAAAAGSVHEEGGAMAPAAPASIFQGLAALLVALGMTPHGALGTLPPATHLPVLIDGVPVGGAPPHLSYAIARALRLGKALAGGVAGGVERMGEGELAGQREAVAALLRAAVGGGFGAAPAVAPAGAKRGKRPSQQLAAALPSLGALGVVPPSLEVALVTPPWWDAAVDPAMEPDSTAATERALAWGFPGATGGASGGGGGSGGGEEGGGSGVQPERLTGLFPGLFLHTVPARPLRPVLQLDTGLVELVSPLEQLFLEIAATPEDGADISPHYTHMELSSMAMLSEIAALTPFSDMNQSPRNMYQCQMCKQTIGTPAHALKYRTDSKLHRILHPQVPLVQNAAQRVLGLDEYPNGANACVAVLAYTGYDMEDACIINKAAFERGWGWAAVYKTYDVDMAEGRPATDAGRFLLHNEYLPGEPSPEGGGSRGRGGPGEKRPDAPLPPVPGHPVWEALDTDGLPPVGAFISQGSPFYATLDNVEGRHKVTLFKEAEGGYVEEVRLLPPSSAAGEARPGRQRASIKLRFDRRPVVGDKFSSRHGQKGVLSFLWPAENMPFSDRGLTPDVLINPHAFPSRMTIGMLVESMAGKVGALNGAFQDATPFRFDEKSRAVDAFGEQLAAAGYNYYGTETMYSGITGEPLGVDIFFGVVYYQRLRHMVKDKAQVRATGPVNALTRQPVKGKKKGGGVRFGEMERDALLAHGGAFLLHDRLHASSDAHTALVCKKCGSMLTTFSFPQAAAALESPAGGAASGGVAPAATQGGPRRGPRRAPMCAACKTGEHVTVVTMPYVFRYLANELAAMNVKLRLRVGEQ